MGETKIVFIHCESMTESKDSSLSIKDFVLQQAIERAYEIGVLGLKEFQAERQRILKEKQQTVDQEYEKKHYMVSGQRKIDRSTRINQSRMAIMTSRFKKTQDVYSSSQQGIAQRIVTDQAQYRVLLKNLIVEGMIKLLEPSLKVRCLKRDEALVKDVLSQCQQEFNSIAEREGILSGLGNITVELDIKYHLEERNPAAEGRLARTQENQKCFGGIILTSADGLIVCKNTLDSRLELAYQQSLPYLRRELFASPLI